MEQEHKQLVIGILAHVDSGKTTLSEALLYGTGTIRKLGRVCLLYTSDAADD